MKRLICISAAFLMGCARFKSTQSTLPMQHTVEHGETISSIAQRYYGHEKQSEGMKAILKANPEIKTLEYSPGIRPSLVVLTIPKVEEKRSSEPGH